MIHGILSGNSISVIERSHFLPIKYLIGRGHGGNY